VTRIVKLGISEKYRDAFRQFTHLQKGEILSFKGCRSLEILNSIADPEIFFTISRWESEDDLTNYRNSPFFTDNWLRIKVWFSQKAEAWSVDEVINNP
jgi:heme-degrading monooxygenase HmoA